MKGIIKFLSESRTELAKVAWPTRSAVISLTIAVLFVGAVITAYTAGVDYLMTAGVKWISGQAGKTSTTNVDTSGGVTATPIDLGTVETKSIPVQ